MPDQITVTLKSIERKMTMAANRKHAISFKRTGEGFYTLNEGDEVKGKFIRMRNVSFNDRETGERKSIRAYDMTVDGKQISISSKALLDEAFDDVFAEIPQDQLKGMEISIIRNKDVETPTSAETGNLMGTYEVLVW